MVEGGRDAAQRLLTQARAEHDRLVEEQAVVVGARERAEAIVAEANAESTRLLADADDYVDRKLAEFEIALQKLTQQVVRGRARLGARRAADLGRLAPEPEDGDRGTAGGGHDAAETVGRHEARESLRPEQSGRPEQPEQEREEPEPPEEPAAARDGESGAEATAPG